MIAEAIISPSGHSVQIGLEKAFSAMVPLTPVRTLKKMSPYLDQNQKAGNAGARSPCPQSFEMCATWSPGLLELTTKTSAFGKASPWRCPVKQACPGLTLREISSFVSASGEPGANGLGPAISMCKLPPPEVTLIVGSPIAVRPIISWEGSE